MTTDPSPATDIDAAILDRMTDTLVILQAKSTSVDRGRMVAALQAIRRQLPADAQLLLVEGEPDAQIVREYLLAIERTSLGAPRRPPRPHQGNSRTGSGHPHSPPRDFQWTLDLSARAPVVSTRLQGRDRGG